MRRKGYLFWILKNNYYFIVNYISLIGNLAFNDTTKNYFFVVPKERSDLT